MGTGSSTQNTTNRYSHPRLGNIKRLQQNNSNHLLVYQIVLQNQKLYEDWVRQLQLVKLVDPTQEILFLPISHSFEQTTFCGSGGLAILTFDDFLYSLQPQIINRREIKRPFNEQELLYLFYSLIKIQALLEAENKSIGDIKPENILVNDDGYIKILSKYSWPEYQHKTISNWQKVNERLFLQECEERYRRKDYTFDHLQPNQCEVFAIGLTILEAGTLRDCSQIYGPTSQYRFSQRKVRELLDILESRYSRELCILVKEMLNPNPRNRIKAETIYQILKRYENVILNLEEFAIKLPPMDNIPRIDRQQKISIKKFGDSQYSQSSDYYENRLDRLDSPPSNLHYSNANNNYMKVSLGTNKQSLTQHLTEPQINPFSNSLQNGSFPQGRLSSPNIQQLQPSPQINYNLVNQYTNFRRQPMSPHRAGSNSRQQFMINSLPANMLQHEQFINPKPQYITQNSMIENIGRHPYQSSYVNY